MMLDMVHHNPGEPLYDTVYTDPAVIKEMGYNGKAYFLFESPTLAITWDSVDKDIFPVGSEGRAWVEKKAAVCRQQHRACRAAGLDIYAMSDLVLFPKSLIEKYKIQDTYGNPQDPQTIKFLKAQIDETFTQFPDLDGLLIRIGETYLHDAPYHAGSINDEHNVDDTIIPLINLLREEICVKRNKKLIFRTWRSFDVDKNDYLKIDKAIELHDNLIFAVKHCEGDFHRANPFSKIIGMGRHPQLIEVQCAREYEGKGAYPNYFMNGVIEGLEEHRTIPQENLHSLREFSEKHPDLFAGCWTWTRGGGWEGPYISNELWCDINAWVLAQWTKDTERSEEDIFNTYASEKLGLTGDNIGKFRKLSLLTADAVLRGRNSTQRDMNPWWTRDQGVGWPQIIAKDSEGRIRNLKQKDESVAMWEEIVKLAEEIEWPDKSTGEFVIASSHYGLRLYKIYRVVVQLEDAEVSKDNDKLKSLIGDYDIVWASYNALTEEFPNQSTLYTQDYVLRSRHIKHAHTLINELRDQLF